MSRVIVTLVGKDHVGIIATVSNYFADNGINILVFDLTDPENIVRAVSGENIGTLCLSE